MNIEISIIIHSHVIITPIPPVFFKGSFEHHQAIFCHTNLSISIFFYVIILYIPFFNVVKIFIQRWISHRHKMI